MQSFREGRRTLCALQLRNSDSLQLAEGVDHFNSLRFWEAHESWERIWLPSEGELRQFLQGLIQLAAAYHHMKRGTFRGAVRLFEAALRRLDPLPAGYCGIDREEAVRAAGVHREKAARAESLATDEYPKLRRSSA